MSFRLKFSLLALPLVAVAGGGPCSVHVSPEGMSLEAALAQVRASAASTREIVLADGDYFLERVIELGPADSNLTIRAEHDGKAVLWGGVSVTGWKKEGDRFFAADLPGVKENVWDFRTLLVNGVMAPRACYPAMTNQLENLGGWTEKLRAAIDGWWGRKPTEEELTTMPYRKGDLPAGFEPRNADVRLYHMWSESFVHVVSNDVEKGVLRFAGKMVSPAGAFGRRKYQIFGIREGMTESGQWYLDRVEGKVVYWPRPGEDMSRVRIVAPKVKTLVRIEGGWKNPVRNLRLEGLVLTGTTTPCMNAGFGGADVPGALEIRRAENCSFERLVIRHVGGTGVKASQSRGLRLSESSVTDCGSSALCIYVEDSEIVSNRLLRAGLAFPSACLATLGQERLCFARNEVAYAPYCGLILRGSGNLIEENHISHVMQVLHDGAAVYGNVRDSVIRGNVVRDVVPNGSGYGASGFYCDETSTDVIIEGNVTIGVPRPCHQHIARDIHVRGNTFITEGDLAISFQNCVGCSFTGNTLVSGGEIKPTEACRTSVTNWSGNRACRTVGDGFVWGGDLPAAAREKPQAPYRMKRSVTWKADGVLGAEEYGESRKMDRNADGRYIGAAPTSVQLAYDDVGVCVGFKTLDFWATPLTEGETWGVDDGIRFTIAGRVFEAYFSGTIYAVDAKGVRTPLGDVFNEANRKGGMARARVVECRIPFVVLGIRPEKGAKLSFSASRRSSYYREERYYVAPGEKAEIVLE